MQHILLPVVVPRILPVSRSNAAPLLLEPSIAFAPSSLERGQKKKKNR